eukprot:4445850-Alexandrium_andersonii.AAC.1
MTNALTDRQQQQHQQQRQQQRQQHRQQQGQHQRAQTTKGSATHTREMCRERARAANFDLCLEPVDNLDELMDEVLPGCDDSLPQDSMALMGDLLDECDDEGEEEDPIERDEEVDPDADLDADEKELLYGKAHSAPALEQAAATQVEDSATSALWNEAWAEQGVTPPKRRVLAAVGAAMAVARSEEVAPAAAAGTPALSEAPTEDQ